MKQECYFNNNSLHCAVARFDAACCREFAIILMYTSSMAKFKMKSEDENSHLSLSLTTEILS